ncbi:MAG: hypothetical protein ABSF77_15430 [Spirochaetia bacterium]|jgi:hypothetical protein
MALKGIERDPSIAFAVKRVGLMNKSAADSGAQELYDANRGADSLPWIRAFLTRSARSIHAAAV